MISTSEINVSVLIIEEYTELALRALHTSYCFFFFNDTATTEIYTLSLHDALPIYHRDGVDVLLPAGHTLADGQVDIIEIGRDTSELQSLTNLVCRLLLEKKKKTLMCLHMKTNKNLNKTLTAKYISNI